MKSDILICGVSYCTYTICNMQPLIYEYIGLQLQAYTYLCVYIVCCIICMYNIYIALEWNPSIVIFRCPKSIQSNQSRNKMKTLLIRIKANVPRDLKKRDYFSVRFSPLVHNLSSPNLISRGFIKIYLQITNSHGLLIL